MNPPRSSTLAATLVATALLIGCASPEAPTAAAGPEIDWDNPIPDGLNVSDVDAAPLPFTPIEPSGLGTAKEIVTTPSDVSVRGQAIIWVFDHPTFGTFWLSEQLGNQTAASAEFKALATQPKEGCVEETSPGAEEQFGEGAGPAIVCYFGRHEFAETASGREVFVTSGETSTAVHWFVELTAAEKDSLKGVVESPAIEMVVIGPSSTFKVEDAMAAANLV
jgi:hypothetical protein